VIEWSTVFADARATFGTAPITGVVLACQVGKGRLVVDVKRRGGGGVVGGVAVALSAANAELERKVTATIDGAAAFASVPPGDYEVTVSDTRFRELPLRARWTAVADEENVIHVEVTEVPVWVGFELPPRWATADWRSDVGGADTTAFRARLAGKPAVADKLAVRVERIAYDESSTLTGATSVRWRGAPTPLHSEDHAGVAPGPASVAAWNGDGALFASTADRGRVGVSARLRYFLDDADRDARLDVGAWRPAWEDPFDASPPFEAMPQEPAPIVGSFEVEHSAAGCDRLTRGEIAVVNGKGATVVETAFEGVDDRAMTTLIVCKGADGRPLAWRDGPDSVEVRARTGDGDPKGVALATLVRTLPRCHQCGGELAKDPRTGALPSKSDPCEVCSVGPVWYCPRCAPGLDTRKASDAKTPLRAAAPSSIFVDRTPTAAPCPYCAHVHKTHDTGCVAFAVVEALEAVPALKPVIARRDAWYRGFRRTEGFLMSWLHAHVATFGADEEFPLLLIAFAALGRSLVGATALSSTALPLEADPRAGNLLGAMLLDRHRGALKATFVDARLGDASVILRGDPIERYLKRTMSLSDAAVQVRVAAHKTGHDPVQVHDWMIGCHAVEVWLAKSDAKTPVETVGSTLAPSSERSKFTSNIALGDLSPSYVTWVTGGPGVALDTATLLDNTPDATLFDHGGSAHLTASRLRAFVTAVADDDLKTVTGSKANAVKKATTSASSEVEPPIERPKLPFDEQALVEGRKALHPRVGAAAGARPPLVARDALEPGPYGVLDALEDFGCACAARCGRGRSECERWVFREVARRLHARDITGKMNSVEDAEVALHAVMEYAERAPFTISLPESMYAGDPGAFPLHGQTVYGTTYLVNRTRFTLAQLLEQQGVEATLTPENLDAIKGYLARGEKVAELKRAAASLESLYALALRTLSASEVKELEAWEKAVRSIEANTSRSRYHIVERPLNDRAARHRTLEAYLAMLRTAFHTYHDLQKKSESRALSTEESKKMLEAGTWLQWCVDHHVSAVAFENKLTTEIDQLALETDVKNHLRFCDGVSRIDALMRQSATGGGPSTLQVFDAYVQQRAQVGLSDGVTLETRIKALVQEIESAEKTDPLKSLLTVRSDAHGEKLHTEDAGDPMLNVFTTQRIAYAASRGDGYYRWRREKDERESGLRGLRPEEFPVYGALNFNLDAGGGRCNPFLGYGYYGRVHLRMKQHLRARCSMNYRSHWTVSRSPLLVIRDLCRRPDEGEEGQENGIPKIVWAIVFAALKLPDTKYQSPRAFFECQVYGGVEFGRDVDAVYVPSDMPAKHLTNLKAWMVTCAIPPEALKTYDGATWLM
jgi:hypothetical protein